MDQAAASQKPKTNQRALRDSKPLEPKTTQITNDVTAILSNAVCRLIQLCDRNAVSVIPVVDKPWIEHFISKYNTLSSLEIGI